MLQQVSTLQNLSIADRLKLLAEFTGNPWFGQFLSLLKEHESQALQFVLNNPPASVEGFLQREQAFGEINGCKHFKQDYLDMINLLLEEVENLKKKED